VLLEILAGQTPGEGFVERGVALPEDVDAGSEFVQCRAVIRSKDLALNDRKVDLHQVNAKRI
jgi:hypothetical protein